MLPGECCDATLLAHGERIAGKIELFLWRALAGDATVASGLRAEVHDEIDGYLDRVCALVAGAMRDPGNA